MGLGLREVEAGEGDGEVSGVAGGHFGAPVAVGRVVIGDWDLALALHAEGV